MELNNKKNKQVEPADDEETHRTPNSGCNTIFCREEQELDVCLKKNMNAPRPSEHPPDRGKKIAFFFGHCR